MNENVTAKQNLEEELDFDELEKFLEADLDEQTATLEMLEKDKEKIGNPKTLSETVGNVVWEQFVNQIGVEAGKDFIEENRGLKLDLSDKAHIQTTENFAKGTIATHNTKINYQERYDNQQSKFERNEDGSIKMHTTRTGKLEANVKTEAREPFDVKRPSGSKENNTDMDHTVSAAEIIRDAAANAHLTLEEQVKFANSGTNLNEIPASWNRSRKDTPMQEWLDTPNSKGQKPGEIFDNMTPDEVKKLRIKDEEARIEYDKRKKEGEKKSIETGKQSQREEFGRIASESFRAVAMGMLAELLRKIIGKLATWFINGARNLKTFLNSIKEAFIDFMHNIKQTLKTAADTLVTTIATAVFGPIISLVKKTWIFLKQGYKSVKEAINYFNSPESKNQPFEIKLLEVSKIIIAGLAGAGAIALSGTIEGILLTFPIFAIQIPLLGSLASILGIFLSAVVSGIIGALALRLVDKAISKKQKELNEKRQIEQGNKVWSIQHKLLTVEEQKLQKTEGETLKSIFNRHQETAQYMKDTVEHILENSSKRVDNDNETKNIKEKIKEINSVNDAMDNEITDSLNNVYKLLKN